MSGSARDGAFTLGDGALEVELWPDDGYVDAPEGVRRRYGREVVLGSHLGQATGVEARVDGRPAASAVLVFDQGCPAISEGHAVLSDGALFVAMRDHAVALAVPSLETRWMTYVDDACVFGLMEIGGADALLLHGEMWITRLGLDGRVQWQRGGADIFTGGCRIDGGAVVAVDWNGTEYRWRLEDGEEVAVVPGAHPPTWANAHNPDAG